MTCLLGIDLGSTSLKAIAFDPDGNVKAAGSRPTEQFRPDAEHPERVVWMPENIWGGTAEAIREVVTQLGDPAQIAGVAVTGMGMDGLPVDEAGKWLYPFISWHDNRTLPQHQWWLNHVGVQTIYQICGHAALPINSINRIMWMGEHEPEILAQTDKWLLIEDFVNSMLCGVAATDYSMAATTQVLDCTRLAWSDELIGLAGVDERLFPALHPSGTVLGEVHAAAAARTGLRPGTPVVLGGHDYLCGALAAGATDPRTLIDITGTWEIAMSTFDRPVLTEEVRQRGVVWDPHVIRDTYCLFIDAVAGSMSEWYRAQFGQLEEEQARREDRSVWAILMAEAAETEAGAGGVTFLPHLSGCTCPVKDPKSHGAFVGISPFAARGMFIRAVIEGLNYQSRQMVEAIESVAGPLGRLRAIGGTVRNAFWMQNKADVLGRPIETPALEEATCLGAAMLAGVGVGLYADGAEAFSRVYRPGRVYQPDPALAERYERLYRDVYTPLYEALRPIHHSIHDIFRGGEN
jgi:xylulokinase